MGREHIYKRKHPKDKIMEAQTERKWGLIIAAIVGVLALCTLMALTGFAIGRSTMTDEPQTITGIATDILTVTAETASSVDEAETVVSVTEAESPTEESLAPGQDEAAASGEAVAAPNTPAPVATDPAAAQSQEPRTDVSEIDLAVFYEAWDFIEEVYDGEIPENEEILQALIGGSVEALDDEFTRYIEPDIAARLREDMSGSVSGIGAFVRENEDGLFEIVSPIEGQPADLAGLLPGDVIIEVDGESVIDLSFDEVILLVRGPEGTTVTLTVSRPEVQETLTFTIVRTLFEVPVVNYEMLEDGIAYVQLVEFSRDASNRLQEALNELLAQNPRGLILDLRNNPGGFLDEAVAVSDIFLRDGVVLFERNVSGLDRTFRSDNGDLAEEIPLVTLVNPGSASASEIVAGAIQDTGRGILIGETTFGKGSVQTVHELSDGSELRVTIARWYTPNDNSIDDEGVAPDIEVEFPADTPEDEDPQLDRAVEYLLTGE
jgi:carboxyl-terminal processing protease